MPCDDASLSELTGYLQAKEPGRRERAEAWATAIGLNREPPRFKAEGGKKKAVRKSGKKTVERVLELIAANPRITFEAMVSTLQITRSTIQKHVDNLKKAGRLRRVGPDKGGHWEVLR